MFPKPVPDGRLEQMRKDEQAQLKHYDDVGYDPESPAHVTSKAMQREKQEQFLEVFSKCLSPKLACKQSGVSMGTYSKWRTSDVRFAERLNEVMEDWRSELLSSAVTRAIGYTDVDEEGNVFRDGSGKIVYSGASDQLAKALLGMDAEERHVGVNVNVVIDLKAAGYDAKLVRSANSEAVDAEYTEAPVSTAD